MTMIKVLSIRDAVSKGTLIELSKDYRTSSTVRAFLPKQTSCAMSSTAFHEHVQQGAAGAQRARVEAFCSSLSNAFDRSGKPSQPDLEFKLPGVDGKVQGHSLKLKWFAENNYWVVLLPDEEIQPAPKLACMTPLPIPTPLN